MFTRSFLREMKRRALRQRIWFRALDNIERGILSLAAQVVERVRSAVLGAELVKILKKIKDALKTGFVRHMEDFGVGRAMRLARQAVEWGNQSAKSWAIDLGFIKYITLIDFNQTEFTLAKASVYMIN